MWTTGIGGPSRGYRPRMRWDRLFDDLEGQLDEELRAEETDLVAEEERLRLGRLALRDRLAAVATGEVRPDAPLRLELRGGRRVALAALTVGRDWLAGPLGGEGAGRSAVIPLAAIAAALPTPVQLSTGLGAEPAGESALALSARLGLAFVLRDLARRRAPVTLLLGSAGVHGTIDRVARDHLDLAEHPPGEPRRASAVSAVRLVPFGALDLIEY